MRRPAFSAIALLMLCVGVGVLAACTKKDVNTNTPTTNVQGTIVNAAANPGLILGITPAKGPAAGGTKVKLTGEGFSGSPKVFFGDVEGKDVSVTNAKEISVTTPAGMKGTVDVTLKNATGPTSSLQGGYTYE